MNTIEQESIVEQKSLRLLEEASEFGASDVHLLPREHDYLLFFRKYGQFTQVAQLPEDLAVRMISFYKYLSSLDISEKRKPQSGAFQRTVQDVMYSFRISTLPSAFLKESLAIRLLKQNYSLPIHSLCHFPESAMQLCSLLNTSSGLLLISGPTGSGKTTTLYSLLQYCAKDLSRHVISLEDPVESTQEQLLQIQVNERAGVTYSAGLKAILRHSPEVIMIGEIRDRETAKIAIEASLSGHLVITTIHAKDTINCLYRLVDLSVSIEDMRQMILAVVTQSLVTTNDMQYKALFEILAEDQLQMAIHHLSNKQPYSLPHQQTLRGQLARLQEMQYEYNAY
ncbi:MAG: competence type IV pilus ATPase ComGA [Solibacillus sp.]|uniref:competence type IV pilus ATPase ComGA n=1 Tax=Solibacillus sp. TaxID=1909654 RepID=UPI00331471C9